MKDAGIDFEDKLYAYDATWPATSKEFKANGLSRTGNLPALEYKGEILNQVRIRKWGRSLVKSK